LKISDEYYSNNYFDINVAPQIKEVITWKLVSQLLRRYPDRYKIIETHPCSGIYDCISLYSLNGHQIAAFNRKGRLHIMNEKSHDIKEAINIWQMLVAGEFQESLDLFCRALDLEIPKHRPASSASVVTYRFMSACISFSCFGYNRYKWVNGYFDTSGFGGGIREKEFSKFKEAQNLLERLSKFMRERGQQTHILVNPAYNFWFLLRNDEPVLCVHIDGEVFKYNDSNNLVKMYRKYKRMFRLVTYSMGDFVAIEEQ